jgi:hypothetical protein
MVIVIKDDSLSHLFFLTTYGVDTAIYDIIPTYYHVTTTPAPAYYCVMSICSSSYALAEFSFQSLLISRLGLRILVVTIRTQLPDHIPTHKQQDVSTLTCCFQC